MSSFSGVVVGRVRSELTDEVLEQAHEQLHRKAIVVVAWYVASYVGMLLVHNWLAGSICVLSLALSMGAVGFNIQHDANHNAFFRTRGSRRLSTANRVAGWSLNAIGGDSKRWIDGHVGQHHTSPNIVGKDSDIELPPFARLAPAQRRRRWHRAQHVYLWVIYAFTSAAIIVGDVVRTIQESVVRNREEKSPTVRDWAALAGSKGVFLTLMLVVPLLLHPWWVVALSAAVVLAVSGLLLGTVFQLAHCVEEADFRVSSEPRTMRWHEWQVRSSVDFCHGRGPVAHVVTWYAGGLNFQTEHHLFPDLPHTVYPMIAPVVRETCHEFGIPYQVQPTLRAAIRSHYRHVRDLGRPEIQDCSLSTSTPRRAA